MHAKIARQFYQHSLQRLNIIKIKPFISKLVELRKKVDIELAIDANIQKLSEIHIQPCCMIDVEFTSTGGRLHLSYQYNDVLIQTSNPTPYIIFDNFEYTQRNLDEEHELRDILLHYHPKTTDEDSITFEPPYLDHILGAIKTKQYPNIKLQPSSAKMPLKGV